jgi:hypothetical protein
MCLLPWRWTCQDIVSSTTKKWNVLPSSDWRNRQLCYMRLGSTNVSHSVTSVLTVKENMLTNSVLATSSLCITWVPL